MCVQPDDGGSAEDCVYASGSGCLSDGRCNATTTSDNLPLAACCEMPINANPGVPCTACPAGFSDPDASGFCYASVSVSQNWDAANTACRALGDSASLAVLYDTVTATSVLTNKCAGKLTGSAFWIGLRCNEPGKSGHTSRTGSYWRWMGSGPVNSWFTAADRGYWNSGERESFSAAVIML